MNMRPNSVKLAIGCIAGSFAISAVQTLVLIGFKPGGLAYEIFGFFIVLLLAFMIYRRKNWARWVFAVCAVVWLASLTLHLRLLAELTVFRGLLLVAQLILWAAATFMLFVPAANDWFRTHDESA